MVATILMVALSTSAGAQSRGAARRTATPADRDRMLAAQVFVDRAGFSPGEIDGVAGANTDRAIDAFERATGSKVADAAAASTDPPTITYTVTREDAATPLVRSIPRDMVAKARLKRLGYTSLLEMLAERFHASPALLRRLNARSRFRAGDQIVVPNVRVVSSAESKPLPGIVVQVSKAASTLTVTDDTGRVIMHAPVTSGSEHDPLPIGMWTVTGVQRNPRFNYNPDLFWDAEPGHTKAQIAPGPNNPVGLVWIDLDKPHYGIHGTPEPSTIGRSESHGCVRLTNWDALRLAAMVGKGTKVEFVDAAAGPVGDLRQRHLTVPVQGVPRDAIRNTFDERRGGGSRRHEAVDIPAPRNTPVVAVEGGTVAKLFLSRAGGNTIYQFDPTSTYAYYYAHLERYAAGLKEGDAVDRGQIIGYVGTSGNAPPDVPHLHFSILRLTDARRWWEGTAIDPYPVFRWTVSATRSTPAASRIWTRIRSST
jgi:lipoprotein-anchoring transpeptidase ErfK/SrfK